MKALKWAIWIISALPFIITSLVMPALPDTVAIHFNSNWKPDGYGSKYVDYVLPIIILVFAISFYLLIRYYEKKAEAAEDDKTRRDCSSNAKTVAISTVVVTAGFTAMQCALLYSQAQKLSGEAIGSSLVGKITNIFIAVTMIVMGNYIPRTKRNSTVGLRISWSMYNDITWERSNRFGGMVLFATGIILLVISLIVSQGAGMVWALVLIAVDLVIILIYAKKVYTIQKALDDKK